MKFLSVFLVLSAFQVRCEPQARFQFCKTDPKTLCQVFPSGEEQRVNFDEDGTAWIKQKVAPQVVMEILNVAGPLCKKDCPDFMQRFLKKYGSQAVREIGVPGFGKVGERHQNLTGQTPLKNQHTSP